VPSLSLVVALASTFLVLEAAAETCPTRKILRPLKLPVEVPDLTVVTLLHARTITDALGAEVILFRPTILAGRDAQSSRTKTFLVTSSVSFCS
jgi:hypothetical protein